jgi:hypothetical protein
MSGSGPSFRPQRAARSKRSAMSVAVGVRLFTRMPWPENSIAVERVKFISPCLQVL